MDPFDEVTLEVITMIGQYGNAVQSVFGGDGGLPFSYTVGLTEHAHPEIMLVGVPVKFAMQILNLVAARVLTDHVVYKPGDRVPKVIEGYDMVIAGPVDPVWNEMYPISMANSIYTRERAGQPLQLVYPDTKGRFPWDDGYDLRAQILLAPVPPGTR